MVKIALIVGARPNFMKAVPIWNAFSLKNNFSHNMYFIHTGQHYTYNLSKIFIDELKIDENDIVYLEKYSKTNYPKTSSTNGFAWIIKNLSDFFIQESIDVVIAFGDVNSTLAASLAAKMNNLMLVHIESGLRSYDMEVPEERNRVLVDKMSDLLFTTELSARENLLKEGICSNIYHCGNTMMDTLTRYLSFIRSSTYYKNLKMKKFNYILFTLHRQRNVDNKNILDKIISSVKKVSSILNSPVLFICHPRTLKNLEKFKIDTSVLTLLSSQSYLNMINLVYNCGILLTDSGGLQEESAYLGVPCVTLRENTERPLTVTKGYNKVISPGDSNFGSIFLQEVTCKYGKRKEDNADLVNEMGNGTSARKIVEIIVRKISKIKEYRS